MKFEDIKKVNETIKTTDVKGKQYAEVNQRIKAFRMLYPMGSIQTYIVSLENGMCVMRAEIKVDDIILGTGTAYEMENSTFINKTSYIENCETSAVGRALAMCGIGIDTSIASKEEVENAIEQQNNNTKRIKLINEFQTMAIKTETDHNKIFEYYGVETLTDMTNEQIQEAIDTMKKKEK